jgi:uncharacterized protein (TIGR03663 family)
VSGERGLRGRTEAAAWAVLIALNLLTHFWSLGERAMSHDESLHAFYSHELAVKGEFKHDPMMHGPLLFDVSALAFLVLGESDAVARVYPAVMGIALLGAVFALRRYLGRLEALLAAALLTLSPSVLFYGRYMRNDVVISVYSVLWIFAAFRYLETRRPRFLYLMTLWMALCFCTKETSFIFGAIMGAWFVGLGLLRSLRRRERLGDSASLELALFMLSLALPFVAAFAHLFAGSNPRDFDSPDAVRRSLFAIAALLATSALLATQGLRRVLGTWARSMLLFWSIAATLFTTFFTNVPRGIVSGVVGSLGYWLAEHSTGRGGQPWFYYLLLGALYEFLPLLVGTAAILALLRRRAGHGRRARFAAFLALWGVASLVAYSVAGEKMPWLMVHVAVPFCLLGGLGLARLASSVVAAAPASMQWMVGLAAPGAAVLLLGPLLWLVPFAGRDSESVASTARFLVHLGAGVSLLAFAWRFLGRAGGVVRRRLLALGGIAFLALLTARSALMLTFVNADLATELLVYAHGTPDIKRALQEIDEVAARTGRGPDIEVAYDDDSAWPLTWYLRVYPRQRYYGDAPGAEAMSAPVVIVGKKNYEKAEPFLENDYVRRDYRLVWWPIETYMRLTWRSAVAAIVDAGSRRDLLQIFLHRRYRNVSLSEWPYRHEFRLYIRRDLAAKVWPLAPPVAESAASGPIQFVPEVRCAPLAVHAGPYAGARLSGPTGVAFAADGAMLVADTGNHRVLVLEPDGRLRASVGRRCEVAQTPEGCDGRFLEPWSVAAGGADEVLVADTWNGRIQFLDARGRFLHSFGVLGLDQPPPIPVDRLYGPRGVAFDPERRRVIVADTGHKRILAFDLEGRLVAQAGEGAATPTRFDEPVGIAVDPRDGSVYVADAWNARIQRLDAELRPQAAWPVPGWGGRDLGDKPYVAVDDRGIVFATVPAKGRVVAFSPAGVPLVSLVASDWRAGIPARPTGVAIDTAAGALLVAEAAGNRVVVLPLVRSAEEQCR